MKDSGLLEVFFKGFVYLLIQFFVLDEIILFEAAQAWIYIALIIILPASTSRIQLLFIAFFYGFAVDIFNNTLGMHAACAVLVAFAKPVFLKIFAAQTPSSTNTETETITIRTNGLSWFLMYTASLVFIYQIAYYMLDASGFSWFGFTIKKIFLSTIFTLVVMVILQYIIYPSRSKR